jgi:hypothetical protein
MRQPLVKNVAGAGVKWLDVSAERFPGWISSFARRHGDSGSLGMTLTDGLAVFTAADGAVAECHPPFPESFAWPAHLRPFTGQAPGGYGGSSPREITAGYGGSSPREITTSPVPSGSAEVAGLMAAHAQVPRSVGVLLVRLGGYAAGVFAGYPPVLADAKTGSRLVHGRSAAGGWSQHRFARRREKQASEALDAAAATAVAVFGRGPRLDAVVLGGDKRAVAELRDDPRLAPYLALATERFLTVPDPKRAVLESTPKLFLAVKIRLTEP